MKRAFLVLVGLALVAAAGFGFLLYKRTSEPFKGYRTTEQFVTIEPGSSTRTIGQRLVEAGVVRDDVTFRAALWRTGRARSLQAGEFRFDQPMTPADVIEKIARGDVFSRRITFPEGLTIREMARVFEAELSGSSRGGLARTAHQNPADDGASRRVQADECRSRLKVRNRQLGRAQPHSHPKSSTQPNMAALGHGDCHQADARGRQSNR